MYNFKEIESKWQKYWEEHKSFEAKDDFSLNKKFYGLIEFPYPSGVGLHLGHIKPYISIEVVSRKRRMEGYNVLFPIGFDAFGLPTENYAIKIGKHPKLVNKENISFFTKQLKRVGYSFDWSRVIDTSDSSYYKWTQWIFLKLFEKGLAYKSKSYINFCPNCNVVLANEECQDGKCDRCGSDVVLREKEVWFLKITAYADRLLEGLNKVDYLPKMKAQQENWIGKSEGAYVDFKIKKDINCIVVHGCPSDKESEKDLKTSTYDKHWMPWLKHALEENKIKCETPIMNTAWDPDYEEWKNEFSKYDINENTVLVGHSCGCSFLVRFLGETKKKINKLILVAPWKEDTRELYKFEIDESIKDRVNDIVIFTSNNEEETGKESAKLFKEKLNARVINLPNKGHYTLKHMGTKEFPELLDEIEENLKVYTTRPDTLFGVTFMVIAPEHPLINKYKKEINNMDEVKKYQVESSKKSEFERVQLVKDKTGVKLDGITAINPVNNEEIPIFISDYVMMGYGTGAIMAVPAHDDRDYDFAKKFNIPIIQVITPYFPPAEGNEYKEGAETVRRKTIIAGLKHPTKDEYLCLDWKEHPWHTFVVGGIEGNETIEEAALRELKEETGYKNIEIEQVFNFETHSSFYAAHKGVNRYQEAKYVIAKLKDLEQDDISDEEKAIHNLVWKKKNELLDFINLDNYTYLANLIINGEQPFTGDGVMINSSFLDDINNKKDAISKMISYLEEKGAGERTTQYKMKDWPFNRQRYWGEPIPIVHCNKCGMVPVPYEELPLKLPEVDKIEPGKNGESPLADIPSFVNCKCPKCGGDAKRETDTMPQWAGSSWYFLRYMDPHNDESLASMDKMKYWGPVDWYNGGMEHITRHILYSRFWNMFLYDIGVVPFEEPYKKRTAQGLVLGADGQKMSKSKGNTVDPIDIIEEYGADTIRTYMLFMGEYSEDSPWSDQGIKGISRFLDKVYELKNKIIDDDKYSSNLELIINKTIKKVSEDIESMKFNTAISSLMILANNYTKNESITKNDFKVLIKLLYPFAPHLTDELNEIIGNKESLDKSEWPSYEESKVSDDTFELIVQINGKVRGKITADSSISEEEMKELALNHENVKKYLEGSNIVKVITVPKKLINIVIR